jgi:hypothetical protein
MPRFVAVNDEGAANSAASLLSSLGSELDDQSQPPEVDWGDDRFGHAMLEAYNDKNLPQDTLGEKPKLGRRLTEVSDATTRAVTDFTTQDLLNTVDINGVQAPEA